eukprot:11827550-Ditylum_brightwellii.AAC.1
MSFEANLIATLKNCPSMLSTELTCKHDHDTNIPLLVYWLDTSLNSTQKQHIQPLVDDGSQ